MEPRWYPVVKGHIAPLEDEAQLLAVDPPGRVKAVVEVHQHRCAVAHRALDLLLDRRRGAGPNTALRRGHGSGAKPAGEHVEEMNAVFHEDPTAVRAVPEPMSRRKV